MSSAERSPSVLPTRARGLVPWTLAAVLAVAVVVLAVLLATGGDEQVGSTGGSSARAACDVLDELPDDPDEDADSLGELQLRLVAASSLGMLAAEQDDGHADLDDALTRMRLTVAAEFSSDVPEFEEAREDAEGECAEL